MLWTIPKTNQQPTAKAQSKIDRVSHPQMSPFFSGYFAVRCTECMCIPPESRGGFVFGGNGAHRFPMIDSLPKGLFKKSWGIRLPKLIYWTVINSWFAHGPFHHVSPLSAGNRLERKKKIVYTHPGTLLKVIHFGQLKSTLYLKLIFLVLRANRENSFPRQGI